MFLLHRRGVEQVMFGNGADKWPSKVTTSPLLNWRPFLGAGSAFPPSWSLPALRAAKPSDQTGRKSVTAEKFEKQT